MRRLACLLFSLVLLLTCICAVADSTPSRTTDDLVRFVVTTENQVTAEGIPAESGFFIRAIGESETEYQSRLDACALEVAKLADAEDVESYFGDVTDAEGNPVDLKDVLQADELNVFEFFALLAGGYDESYGTVTANMLLPTPYEAGEEVIAMVGLVDDQGDGTQSVEWTAYNGIGIEAEEGNTEMSGCIQVELDPDIVTAIQEGVALMAIVSA